MSSASDHPIIGYTTGVFDLFHPGHLNILKSAKSMCDQLIVGVTTDECAAYKGKTPTIPYHQRAEIVRSIVYVDVVVAQHDMDKFAAWQKLGFHRMFVGDDWHGTDKWKAYEEQFGNVGVDIVYFPYTPGFSTSDIIKKIQDQKDL